MIATARVLTVILLAFPFFLFSQNNFLTYAGNGGAERFYDLIRFDADHYLLAGTADDLDWIAPEVTRIQLDAGEINNDDGTGKTAFLLLLANDLEEIKKVYFLPSGGAEDFRYLKSTKVPTATDADIFVSGNTSDSKDNNGGYFIAKLNLTEGQEGFDWVENIWAEGYPKSYHPWDVDSQGRVYYVRGQSHDYDWAAMHRLDENGQRDVVENWRTHWKTAGGEWRGTPASAYSGGVEELEHSGIVLKFWGRCDLRSWNEDDYQFMQPDENGGMKQGLWPMDILFNSPCDPDDPTSDGGGYTGYNPPATPVYGASSIVVDKSTDHVYLGMNTKSVLPGGNPDFEPAVICFDETGALQWWSRLYHEIQPDGELMNSTPDQYVDALEIGYDENGASQSLVVAARCHGNNVENFWEGNEIDATPDASGFQNRFTGTSGNIHISWLGKLNPANGTLLHSTYVAEFAEGADGLGGAHPDPNLAGFPNPNAGWPTLNTTRLARNNMHVGTDGTVVIAGTGRRTITTANAHQQMVLPQNGGLSSWNQFVRAYSPDLSVPLYSSLIVGEWDTLTQQGGGNTAIHGVFKTAEGIVAFGHQKATDGVADGNLIPVSNLPEWGKSSPENESAILAHFTAENIFNENDSPSSGTVNSITSIFENNLGLYPNPASQSIFLKNMEAQLVDLSVYDLLGREIIALKDRPAEIPIDISSLKNGAYFILVRNGKKELRECFIKK